MRPEQSPFRPYWWPDVDGTDPVDHAEPPPIPFPLTGDLAWLATQPVRSEWDIGRYDATGSSELAAACARVGVSLPATFVALLASADLRSRIRSSSGDYLAVDRAPVPAPTGDGYLVRFLTEGQGLVCWYLHLTAGDHAVVWSARYFDSTDSTLEDEQDEDDEEEGEKIEFCDESFEAFLYRYWLQNEISFARHGDTPPPDVGTDIIERYRTFYNISGQ
jgi:hypothetical protein